MKHNLFELKTFSILLTCIFLASACTERKAGDVNTEQSVEIDSTKTGIINIAGKLFSIPSPVQTAMMIKKSGTSYNAELLNSPKNVDNYSTRIQQSLNLGVYGADLGFASLYEDNQGALNYFKAIEKLANKLGVLGAIDKSLVQRFGANVGNTDSLLILTSNFYTAADVYLKQNERYDVAALVLAGGWVEASFMTAKEANKGNVSAKERLSEQKQALESLVMILQKFAAEDPEIQEIKTELSDLLDIYKKLDFKYTYNKPETFEDRKLTRITSSSEVKMTEDQLKQISEKINSLRTKIAG